MQIDISIRFYDIYRCSISQANRESSDNVDVFVYND